VGMAAVRVGLAIGLLVPIISETVHRVAPRYLRLTPEEVAKLRSLVRARRLVIIPTGVALGLTIGLLAASWMAAWVDLIATVIVVLSLLPVLILFPALKSKREGRTR
jgi:MFS family permease